MGILSAFRFAFQNLFFTPILYGVIASLAVFSTVWDRGDRLKDQLTDGFRSQHDTFDFIIGKYTHFNHFHPFFVAISCYLLQES